MLARRARTDNTERHEAHGVIFFPAFLFHWHATRGCADRPTRWVRRIAQPAQPPAASFSSRLPSQPPVVVLVLAPWTLVDRPGPPALPLTTQQLSPRSSRMDRLTLPTPSAYSRSRANQKTASDYPRGVLDTSSRPCPRVAHQRQAAVMRPSAAASCVHPLTLTPSMNRSLVVQQVQQAMGVLARSRTVRGLQEPGRLLRL